jgi:hypothetical protein
VTFLAVLEPRSVDRSMMHALRVLSSSEPARAAAAAWLADFDAARAAGLGEAEAYARAEAARARALYGGESGAAPEGSGMLAATCGAVPQRWPAPRSPPG